MSVERFLDINQVVKVIESTEQAVLLVVDKPENADPALKFLDEASDYPKMKEGNVKCFLVCVSDVPDVVQEVSSFEVSPTYYYLNLGDEIGSHRGLPKSSKALEESILKSFANAVID